VDYCGLELIAWQGADSNSSARRASSWPTLGRAGSFETPSLYVIASAYLIFRMMAQIEFLKHVRDGIDLTGTEDRHKRKE
jgi:hypothetical protein